MKNSNEQKSELFSKSATKRLKQVDPLRIDKGSVNFILGKIAVKNYLKATDQFEISADKLSTVLDIPCGVCLQVLIVLNKEFFSKKLTNRTK